MGYHQAIKDLTVRMYLEGSSFRGIGKVLSVQYVSVSNWVSAHASTLPDQVTETTRADTVETDELLAFVGEKRAYLRLCSGVGSRL
jgi:hypothetical protein